MEQCDMVCGKCFCGSEDYESENNERAVLCKLGPEWKLISEIKIDDKFPDINEDPNYHYCASGKWVDENGKIIGYLDAQDALVRD